MKFNSLIPELSVSNIEESKKFYQKLGFKIIYERIEDKFVFLELENNQIMLEEINDNWNTGKSEYPFGRGIKKDNKLIGDIYIYLIEKDKKAKVAIRLNPKYHNKGIGTEAVESMVNWCFQNTELIIIWSDVDKKNISSIKLLEKCGFKRKKEVKQGKMVSTVCDYYIYELNK